MYDIFEQLLQKNGITTYKLCKDTGISQTTISNWKTGRSIPKQDKMKTIADYFNVSIEYLTSGKEKEGGETYYLNEETKEIAETIFNNPNLKMLFDASKNASAKRLMTYYNMISELEKKEND